MIAETLEISPRFCGPSQSGNGGYVCGRLAKHVSGPASVRLKVPPPLEVEMTIEVSDGSARLLRGTTVIGEARPTEFELSPPPPPTFREAETAARSYSGFTRHSFPNCFVCGPKRAAADGMRLFPGRIDGRSVVAAPWIPDATLAAASNKVGTEFLWAALDCPSAFSFLPVAEGQAVVLGELCVRIDAPVSPGDRCIVMGWPVRVEGRKHFAGSAVFTESGGLIACGLATWIEVPASAFPEEAPS